jgi:hypothetical protein
MIGYVAFGIICLVLVGACWPNLWDDEGEWA